MEFGILKYAHTHLQCTAYSMFLLERSRLQVEIEL